MSYCVTDIKFNLSENGLCKCDAEKREGRVGLGPGVTGLSAGAGEEAWMFLRSTRQYRLHNKS